MTGWAILVELLAVVFYTITMICMIVVAVPFACIVLVGAIILFIKDTVCTWIQQ